ncbi:MAG: hypothetical protein ACJAUW_000094, partial [Yoonia sp.]
NTAFLWASLHVERLGSCDFWLARLADQLLNRWHRLMFPSIHISRPANAGFKTCLPFGKHKNAAVEPLPEVRCGELQRNKATIARFLATTWYYIGTAKAPLQPGSAAYMRSRRACQQRQADHAAWFPYTRIIGASTHCYPIASGQYCLATPVATIKEIRAKCRQFFSYDGALQ